MSPHLADVSSGGDDPPILLLPNEITAEIFTRCLLELPSVDSCLLLPPVDSSLLLGCPSPCEAPLLLGQICGQWRDICIDTPEVWPSIAFARGSIQLLELWLSRARDYPLTLFLQTQDEARAEMFMKAILPHRSQWRDVTLILPSRALYQLGSSSLLHTPLLRHVDIRYLPQIELPFEQWTILHFCLSFKTTEAVGILRRCQNLLDLNWGRGHRFDVPILSPVELLRLRSLAADHGFLLRFLTVPRLERLDIRSAHTGLNELRLLMLRSSCDLRVLSCLTPAAQLQNLFRTVSTVVHLKLDRASIEIQSPALADILWRHEEDTLVRFELLLQEYMPIPFAAAMTAFRALADRGLHVS
ncbi:hypothetical protein DFH08DRAFT_1081818 [Mycena albidolilacea]|uniref:F-box domain-containing protein n=1 Tax=Mycena albidolilacea TaxID=1033008 RepID=A0AAD7EP32_9AGAR|nr:hypothetical protein DFH08DRAFT_1081818 [Mycena albidolilacea]